MRGPDPACRDCEAGLHRARQGRLADPRARDWWDRATREALDNFQAARDANGANDLRHTITHLQAIDAADIPRFAALGVVGSMSLQWARRTATRWTTPRATSTTRSTSGCTSGRRAVAGWRGGRRWQRLPRRSAAAPMVQIETAVDHTGEAVPGVYPGALSPRKCRTFLAVIKMHTINSAWQMHMDRDHGLIEVGKFADLVVLDQNLFEVPTDRSPTPTSCRRSCGRVVYDAAASGARIEPRPRRTAAACWGGIARPRSTPTEESARARRAAVKRRCGYS